MPDIAERIRRIFAQRDFAGLLGTAFVLGLGFSFVSPFLSLWGTQEIGLAPSTFGLYMTATSFSAIFVGTTFARWSDTHVARKVMLLLGGAGGALGYAGYAFFHDPRGLLAIGVTLLAVAAVCFSQLFAHVRERFFGHGIPGVPPGFLMSIVRVCFSIAWTAGPTVGAWVMLHHGFRGLFLGAATLYGLFLLGVVRFVPYEPRSAETRAVVREPVWRVLTRRDIFAVFAAFLLVLAAHIMNLLNLPLYITGELGGTGRDVGITFGIGPAAEIPLMLWFGLLAARGHHLGLIRFGAAATVIYFLLLPCARVPWHVFPIQILNGLSFAILSNVGIQFFQELVPGQPGLATTIYTNAANIGNLIGFFTFGALVQPLGHRGLSLVSAALTVVTFVILMLHRPNAARSAAA
ncbi:MAG TPA: sugar efflux transporter [Opitutaceae bacterium]|nr:sugar efflux transporter [Opitutaceae bacterium]